MSDLRAAIRQFAFDIVMSELGLDESDPDDQEFASEAVDAWMQHWDKTGASVLSDADLLGELVRRGVLGPTILASPTGLMGDAPLCAECGHITIPRTLDGVERFVCLNCLTWTEPVGSVGETP